MPSAARFILKDSHPAVQDVALGVNESNDGDAVVVAPAPPQAVPAPKIESPTIDYTRGSKSPEKKRGGGILSWRSPANATSPKTPVSPKASQSESRDATAERVIESAVQQQQPTNGSVLQGRAYCTERAQQPGGLKLGDMTLGMKYACMAITDDNEGTLKGIGKTNPWQLMGMKLMLKDSGRFNGTFEELNEEIHKPLTYLLMKYYDLTLDTHIDVNGWKGGHVLDTQGYIAHNDSTIVLAYRCTTSAKDWLTNLATTTSAWETSDIEQGHSGVFSGVNFGKTDVSSNNGRVHTGFYNNFLSTVPMIHQYLDPLLEDTSKPKTFYIVGHSLGGGIAHMAFAYFLLEFQERYNWGEMPHKIVLLTAGSPRAYTNTMAGNIDNRLAELKDKASVLRLVRDKDTVSNVPPSSLGFNHCSKFVYITKDDAILINPNVKNVVKKATMRSLLERHPSINVLDTTDIVDNDDDDSTDEVTGSETETRDITVEDDGDNSEEAEQRKYERTLSMIPRSLRDHMPEFYLKPLINLLQIEKKCGSAQSIVNQERGPNENLVIVQTNSKVTTTQISYDLSQQGDETIDVILGQTQKRNTVSSSKVVEVTAPSSPTASRGFGRFLRKSAD